MLSHIGLLLWLSYEAKTDRTQADKNKVTNGLLGKPKKPKRTRLRFVQGNFCGIEHVPNN